MENVNLSWWIPFVSCAMALWGLSFFRRRFAGIIWGEAALNVTLTYLMFFYESQVGWSQLRFLVFAGLLYWLVLRLHQAWWLIIGFPVGVIALSRGLPLIEMGDLSVWLGSWAPPTFASTGFMSSVPAAGISYLAFRWLKAGLEIKSESCQLGSPAQFITFSFFTPTFFIGPISSYQFFSQTYGNGWVRSGQVLIKSLARLLWGACKFFALSAVAYQLTFSRGNILLHLQHPWAFFTGLIAYPAYLFLNFSGFIDMMIGTSALLGVAIEENFDRPYLATSIRDFWRRWHMTLTSLLKPLIYIPFFKASEKLFNQNKIMNFIYIPATILVFIVMAYWHGPTWNFVVFGLLHALALVCERLLTNSNLCVVQMPVIVIAFIKRIYVLTFLAISFFFFENDPNQINSIWQRLSY